jgi:hypothetical protein
VSLWAPSQGPSQKQTLELPPSAHRKAEGMQPGPSCGARWSTPPQTKAWSRQLWGDKARPGLAHQLAQQSGPQDKQLVGRNKNRAPVSP